MPAAEKYATPLRFDRIDRLRDDSVLKEGLVEIADIVGDDLRARGRERADAGGEIRLAVFRRVESKTRAGRNGVHDLQHRPALVAERRLRRRAVGQAVAGGGRRRSEGSASTFTPDGSAPVDTSVA